MKNKLIIGFVSAVLVMLSPSIVNAQDLKADTTVYKTADTKPEFPGGESRMQEYVDFRLNGEQSGAYDLKEGTVVVEFIVEKNGRIKQVAIVESLDPIFDENFANIFRGMPKWKPAQKNGQPVRYLLKYGLNMNYYMHK